MEHLVPRGPGALGLGRQVAGPDVFQGLDELRQKLADAAGLDRLDLQPRQPLLQPVAKVAKLLAVRQSRRHIAVAIV